jgi:predicted transcriptional regulator
LLKTNNWWIGLGKLLEIKVFLELIKEGKSKLITIDCNDCVDKAIELMLKNEFSQLPVMKGDKMVGVISYESLAKTVFSYSEAKSKLPSKLRVRDFMEKVSKIFNTEEDVIALLDRLAEKSFVFVSKRDRVTDIITSFDALKFFRACGEDFLILNDIEIILRKIIADKFDASSFAEESKSCLKKKPKTVNDIEFSEYDCFIEEKWADFKDILLTKDFFEHLDKVRRIRNDVCHFKNQLGSSNREYLLNILKWLKGRVNQDETYSTESLACICYSDLRLVVAQN